MIVANSISAIHNLSSAPLNPFEGQCYFNTIDNFLYIYSNGSWIAIDSQANNQNFDGGRADEIYRFWHIYYQWGWC